MEPLGTPYVQEPGHYTKEDTQQEPANKIVDKPNKMQRHPAKASSNKNTGPLMITNTILFGGVLVISIV